MNCIRTPVDIDNKATDQSDNDIKMSELQANTSVSHVGVLCGVSE